eukprot:ANDGO_00372.mRNA.1 GTPase-activating protein gyp10
MSSKPVRHRRRNHSRVESEFETVNLSPSLRSRHKRHHATVSSSSTVGSLLGSRAEKWAHSLRISHAEIEEANGIVADFIRCPRPHSHRDYDQVEKDINRSFVNCMYASFMPSEEVRQLYRTRLAAIIHTFMEQRQADRYYFQGLHDVVSILLVSSESDGLTLAILQRLTDSLLKLHMQKDLTQLLEELSLFYPLLRFLDEHRIAAFFESTEMPPFFLVPWVLTWFSHDCEDLYCVLAVFDEIFDEHPMFVLYVSAFLIGDYSDEIIRISKMPPNLDDSDDRDAMAGSEDVCSSVTSAGNDATSNAVGPPMTDDDSPFGVFSAEVHKYIQHIPTYGTFPERLISSMGRAKVFIRTLTPAALVSACGMERSSFSELYFTRQDFDMLGPSKTRFDLDAFGQQGGGSGGGGGGGGGSGAEDGAIGRNRRPASVRVKAMNMATRVAFYSLSLALSTLSFYAFQDPVQ